MRRNVKYRILVSTLLVTSVADFGCNRVELPSRRPPEKKWPSVHVDWRAAAEQKRILSAEAESQRMALRAAEEALVLKEQQMQLARQQAAEAELAGLAVEGPPGTTGPGDEPIADGSPEAGLASVEDRRAAARELVKNTLAASGGDQDDREQQRAMLTFREMMLTDAQRKQRALQREQARREGRKHGAMELARLDSKTDLAGIRYLFLRGNEISDSSLRHLKDGHELRLLNLNRVNITDAGLEHLKELTSLRLLVLEFVDLSETGLSTLRSALPETTIQYISTGNDKAPAGPFIPHRLRRNAVPTPS